KKNYHSHEKQAAAASSLDALYWIDLVIIIASTSLGLPYHHHHQVSRQHSRSTPVKTLFPCSYHTFLKFGGNADIQDSLLRVPSKLVPEAAKELHDKLLKSVVDQRTAPPNNWMWTLMQKCENREDIKLLFNILEKLRKFKLSNL
nr:putative NADH dehydrogenase [ubiquinone] 1 alpha subcomplex subunit 5, mitochondrial [Tanacetum cinerariifolium]